ncbi:zinc finger RNA-binding protein-like isoform X2 [Asterias rubens]|uniref:zinc finger RNA-binding protein-like isoform X2 n=1 Tax=Asterias rubens TaxID=7604 RepID=UPI00145550E1|nr:zinc finger RNA-binding protein-like isoform X2 [Asterias rubens]
MASQNYFGLTHGGAQYSSQPQQSTYAQHTAQPQAGHVYQTATPVAAHQTTYASTVTPRQTQAASGMSGYETGYATVAAATHQTGQYGYSTQQRQDTQAPTPAPAQTYRESYNYVQSTPVATSYEKQSYYQQPQAQHNTTDTYYQQTNKYAAAKQTAYSNTGSASAYTSHQQAAVQKPAQTKTVVTYAYAPQTTTQTYASTPATTSYSAKEPATAAAAAAAANSYSSYDSLVYSAATSYYQQQQQQVGKMGSGWGFKSGGGGGGGGGGNKTNYTQNKFPPKKDRQPPKQPQIHYCEVCKISCAGPQTYREHLEGQKHKKKEQSQKEATPIGRPGQIGLRCELCDVSCTGLDAYNAHIKGAKHQKVLKLHTKLGKPIPSSDPIKVSTTTSTSAATTGNKTAAAASTTAKPKPLIKKVVTPKITFVGGSKLASTSEADKKVDVKMEVGANAAEGTTAEVKEDLSEFEKEIIPVGEDYIDEIKNEEGKLISFNCKLCECKFNDPNAKDMHMKGRRHRLHYKKKVDPSYSVDMKPSNRTRKVQEEKMRRQFAKEEFFRQCEENRWQDEISVFPHPRRYEEDMYWRRMEEERYWEERRIFEEEMEFFEWQRRRGIPHPRPVPPKMPGQMDAMKRPDSEIDRHVMAKHTAVYPSEQELQSVQAMVSNCEKALKLVSDFLAEADTPAEPEEDKAKVKEEPKTEAKEKEGEEKMDAEGSAAKADTTVRVLKGVMRVGVLAKGLLLKGDLNMGLVVLCAEKPTRTLLERVVDALPKQLTEVTEDKYDMKLSVEEAGFVVSSLTEPKMTMKVTLTSPVMRDTAADAADTAKDPPDVLDRQKCLEALAALRHAKWFQARATGLQSCVMIIRILRDLCERIPTWAPLNGWPMELLCERVIASRGQPLRPGDSLRRVFEAIAGGLLLPSGPGLFDPCEKDPTDALAHLDKQQCEDITASAQHALRLIVFRQIHKVLGMEALPVEARTPNRHGFRRKRRHNESEGGENGDGKKDKKDDESDVKMEAADTKAEASK